MIETSLPLDTLRDREFGAVAGSGYFNAASLGPLPARSLRALREFNERRGAVQRMREEDFILPLQRSREGAARLIGASPDEIALVGNTSAGLNLAARGLALPAGSTILASDREFPANVYPWMAREASSGVRFEMVPVTDRGWPDQERILERLGRGDVSVLATSSVQFDSGFAADLPTLGAACHAVGAYFVVDAIQSMGHLPTDVSEACIDVLATGGHKWLCSPFGTGFVYVRREVQERLEPTAIGWSSMRSTQDLEALLDYEWSLLPDARRYEAATQPLQDYAAFAESVALLLEADPTEIARHVRTLLEPLRRWAQETEEVELASDPTPERLSGIVAFKTRDVVATFAALRAGGIVCALREGAIRISAHLYNTAADVGRLLDVLDSR